MSTQHNCPWPFCSARVDADLWGCKHHWYQLPPVLRKALWEAYRPGQTAATASDEYRAAALNIETWVRLYFQTVGVSFGGPKIGRPAKSQRQGDLPL